MTGVGKDLATLRNAAAHGVSEGFYEREEVDGAYKRVEAELARLREERDAEDWRTLEIILGQLRAAEARCAHLQDANDRLLSEKARLQQALESLVALVRIGFLVTVDGVRGTPGLVQGDGRDLLLTILGAVDSASAVEALAGPDTEES